MKSWIPFLALSSLLSVVFISRIGWFLPNWAMVGALALWLPHFIRSLPASAGLILIILFASDWVLGFYPEQIWVYFAYVPYLLAGLLPFRASLMKPLIGSIGFFLVSNFGVWMSTQFYVKTPEGLIQCYQMAIPFFKVSLLSDYFYFVTFGALYYIYRALTLRPYAGSAHTSR